MPRYRLRTLLILISVLAVVLARVAYLKRQRDFHRHEVNRLVAQLAAFQKNDSREIEQRVSDAAEEGPSARGSWTGGYLSGQYGSPEYENTLSNWHSARQHEILANRYSRAIYRPWELVWDDPNSVPDRVPWMDLRVATYSALLALAMLAAWRVLSQGIVVPKNGIG